MVKQRQDSVAAYEQGGRPELAQAERDEIAVIQSFMPKQMTEEEAKSLVESAVKSAIEPIEAALAEAKALNAANLKAIDDLVAANAALEEKHAHLAVSHKSLETDFLRIEVRPGAATATPRERKSLHTVTDAMVLRSIGY
jgi:hypothetical protein